jgi:hypothetical protein
MRHFRRAPELDTGRPSGMAMEQGVWRVCVREKT